jgi:hypothetical protein
MITKDLIPGMGIKAFAIMEMPQKRGYGGTGLRAPPGCRGRPGAGGGRVPGAAGTPGTGAPGEVPGEPPLAGGTIRIGAARFAS